MVDDNVFGGMHNLSVHNYCFSGSPFSSLGVKGVFAFSRAPFILIEFFKIVCIDDCVFTLAEWDFPEGAAVAQPSIQKQGPNAENLYDCRYFDFDCKLDSFDPGCLIR